MSEISEISEMSEPVRVDLVQCLCPARHCIMAAAFQCPPGTQEEAIELCRSSIERNIADKQMQPWCGICAAPRNSWSFEIASLPGLTLDAVMPALRASEAAQMETAATVKAVERHSRN